MDTTHINMAIAGITNAYRQLNREWENDPCLQDISRIPRLEEYRLFLVRAEAFPVETLMLEMVAAAMEERVLAQLKAVIRENIRIYKDRAREFEAFDGNAIFVMELQDRFASKMEILAKQRQDVLSGIYPLNNEKQMLVREIGREMAALGEERDGWRRQGAWIRCNYYRKIYRRGIAILQVISAYFPGQGDDGDVSPEEVKEKAAVSPDRIFRTKMYERFLKLEQQLAADNYIGPQGNWILLHRNKKPDRKTLVIFLCALADNRYFLPGRDALVRDFFEDRFKITIGQNFEKKRREQLAGLYPLRFYNYGF